MSHIKFEVGKHELPLDGDTDQVTIGQYTFIDYVTGWFVQTDNLVVPKAGKHMHVDIDYKYNRLMIIIKEKKTSRDLNLRVIYGIQHSHHWIDKFKAWIDTMPNADYTQYGEMFDKQEPKARALNKELLTR